MQVAADGLVDSLRLVITWHGSPIRIGQSPLDLAKPTHAQQADYQHQHVARNRSDSDSSSIRLAE